MGSKWRYWDEFRRCPVHGVPGWRYTSNRQCIECHIDKNPELRQLRDEVCRPNEYVQARGDGCRVHGLPVIRYKSNRMCVACARTYRQAHYEKHGDAERKRKRDYMRKRRDPNNTDWLDNPALPGRLPIPVMTPEDLAEYRRTGVVPDKYAEAQLMWKKALAGAKKS